MVFTVVVSCIRLTRVHTLYLGINYQTTSLIDTESAHIVVEAQTQGIHLVLVFSFTGLPQGQSGPTLTRSSLC